MIEQPPLAFGGGGGGVAPGRALTLVREVKVCSVPSATRWRTTVSNENVAHSSSVQTRRDGVGVGRQGVVGSLQGPVGRDVVAWVCVLRGQVLIRLWMCLWMWAYMCMQPHMEVLVSYTVVVPAAPDYNRLQTREVCVCFPKATFKANREQPEPYRTLCVILWIFSTESSFEMRLFMFCDFQTWSACFCGFYWNPVCLSHKVTFAHTQTRFGFCHYDLVSSYTYRSANAFHSPSLLLWVWLPSSSPSKKGTAFTPASPPKLMPHSWSFFWNGHGPSHNWWY